MTDNIFEAVYELIDTCPLVGDMYFNFIDRENNNRNTSLLTVAYGQVVKKYVDGDRVLRTQFEIRQEKPLAVDSNTLQNVEQLTLVQQFMDWINEQGKNKNFPVWGNNITVQKMGTPDGVNVPGVVSTYENSVLYGFPFEIVYLERN